MKVLVVGNGAREAATVWKLKQSPLVSQVFAAPGNAGMEKLAKCITPSGGDADELGLYVQCAIKNSIDLTIVGLERLLVDGIVDRFHEQGLTIFGPTKLAARLEGSKIWAKDLMQRVGIPTAAWRPFSELEPAREYARQQDWHCVIKADGLAQGKGSFVCTQESDVDAALDALLVEQRHGGGPLLIEELLDGQEVSVFAITDGSTVLPFGAAQDHKRLHDNDEGPNTGGMGAYSPVAHMRVASEFAEGCFRPLVRELASNGTPYVGFLYAGAIITTTGPKILEFNVRLGDPEAQVLLPRLETDLADLVMKATDSKLHTVDAIEWKQQEALCVVVAADTYPNEVSMGQPIHGLAEASQNRDVEIFHAGTIHDESTNTIVTSGGRILSVTGLGSRLEEARSRAYSAVEQIEFKGMYYRTDIGTKAIGSVWDSEWRKPHTWDYKASESSRQIAEVAAELDRLVQASPSELDRGQLQRLSARLYEIRRSLSLASSDLVSSDRDSQLAAVEAARARAAELVVAMQRPGNRAAIEAVLRRERPYPSVPQDTGFSQPAHNH